MSRISSKNREKIKQEILRLLFEANLLLMSTKTIADELIRNDEMILVLLTDLQKLRLIERVGAYKKRRYWRLTAQAYQEYKKLAHL